MAVYEVVLEGALDANPMLTVLHYDVTGSVDFHALAQEIALEIIPDLQELLVPSASYSGITVREDTPGSVGIFYGFTGGPIVGSNAVTNFWGYAAANVKKLTSSGSRPAQGRIYQGGIPSGNVDLDGRLTAALRTALAAFWSNMLTITFATSGEANMVIKASNPTAPNTVPYNPVTGILVSDKPTKQSRRNFGA